MRFGNVSEKNRKILESRIIPLSKDFHYDERMSPKAKMKSLKPLVDFFIALQKENPNTMCLFGKRDQVEYFNMCATKESKIKTVKIHAIDCIKSDFNKPISIIKDKKSRDTAGLVSELNLGIGIRVMLLKKQRDQRDRPCHPKSLWAE